MIYMTDKKILLVAALIVPILIASGCTNQPDNAAVNTSQAVNFSAPLLDNRLEVFHFHATRQCTSCINAGKYAEETLKKYFQSDLDSGRIVFKSINVESPENQEIVSKYGATGSSLWLGVYNSSGFFPEENTAVWYKTLDENAYLEYFKGVVESKLSVL